MRRKDLANGSRVGAAGALVAAGALLCAACSTDSAPASPPGAGGALAIQQTPALRPASPSLGDLLTYDYGITRSGDDKVDPAIANTR